MAIEKGAFGIVQAGGNSVGEMTGYEFTEEARTEETIVGGTDEVRHSPTLFTSSGSVSCYVDDADSGQQALGAGVQVTLLMQPEGTGTGKPQRSVTATITTITEPLDPSAYNRVTFNWVGGKVDRTAQA